jgi:hypothetical protein
MFTDQQATPARLEILVDLMRNSRNLSANSAARLLQPKPLTDGNPPQAAAATIKAAKELGIVDEDGGSGRLSLLPHARKATTAKSAVLTALDDRVLRSTEVEPYFALFYAFVLGLGKGAYKKRDRDAWAADFNHQVFSGERQSNPFNKDKVSGLDRWLSYAGLGWYDPAKNFQANPHERLHRALPAVFGKERKMSSERFMERLADICPELDGGALFQRANPAYDPTQKHCTLGLSHALIELEIDGVLRLYRPLDSTSWNIKDGEPPIGEDAQSKGERISFVELLTRA